MNWSRLMPLHYSDNDLRQMYAGQRGNVTARRFARFWATLFAWGVAPRRWVTLEVVGRTSGKALRFPLGEADLDGRRYLVSMLGNDSNWVRNVRAANGLVFLVRRTRVPCLLVEIPVDERAPIIRRYLHQVPGARPHIPVDRHADVYGSAGTTSRRGMRVHRRWGRDHDRDTEREFRPRPSVAALLVPVVLALAAATACLCITLVRTPRLRALGLAVFFSGVGVGLLRAHPATSAAA